MAELSTISAGRTPTRCFATGGARAINGTAPARPSTLGTVGADWNDFHHLLKEEGPLSFDAGGAAAAFPFAAAAGTLVPAPAAGELGLLMAGLDGPGPAVKPLMTWPLPSLATCCRLLPCCCTVLVHCCTKRVVRLQEPSV